MSYPAFLSMMALGPKWLWAPGIQLPSFVGNSTLNPGAAADADTQTDLPGAPRDVLDLNGSTHGYVSSAASGITGSVSRSFVVTFKNEGVFGVLAEIGFKATGQLFSLEVSFPNSFAAVAVNGGRIDSTAALNDDNWHQMAVTLEEQVGDTRLEHVKLYLDGEQLAVNRTNNPLINTFFSSVYVGRNRDNNVRFNGDLAELAIFDRALSAQAIATAYENRKGIRSWSMGSGIGIAA